jgi:hypothetical protein
MPLYNLACRRPLDLGVRERVARAITEAHCEVTGAPPSFVNVLFLHGYALRGGLEIDVIGGVRKGGNRTPELLERLRSALRDAIAKSSGKLPAEVAVSLLPIPAGWIMEGGRVLPEPGDEASWTGG